MCHCVKNHRRGSLLCTDVGREFHDAVWLTAHQSSWCGIVECEARDHHLIKPHIRELRLRGGAPYYNIPRRGVEEIQKEPKHEDSHEPIARMLKTFPHLLKVELGDHQSEQY